MNAPQPTPVHLEEEIQWRALLAAAPGTPDGTHSPLHALYGPLRDARQQPSFAIGHLAQSLDGRIATVSGVSRWLSGNEDLLHTHRMRALADAVLVGASTVLHDDPQLTVRLCPGTHPVRVVLDPRRRLDGSQRVFHDGVAPTLLLVGDGLARPGERFGNAEVVPLPCRPDIGLDPLEVRRSLARRGLRWLFVEGGGVTVSRFLAAGALDRLQFTVAPVILGSGRPSIVLPEITDLCHSLRPRTRRFLMGEDVMIECDFRG